MKATKIGIFRDTYLGYEVRIWKWYWPFWTSYDYRSFSTVEAAEEFAKSHYCLKIDGNFVKEVKCECGENKGEVGKDINKIPVNTDVVDEKG